MPNPFPGMNPYFESTTRWSGFHTRFITHLSDQLNERLPDEFVANVEERLYLVQDKRTIVADFAVARRIPTQQMVAARPQPSGGTAVLEREPLTEPQWDAPRILQIEPVEIRERFIEIVAVGDGQEREVVAVIKVLSPTNKTGQGREEYQNKQHELLQTNVHFLEMDLLRGGTHTVDLPVDELRLEGVAWDYLVVLHRAERRGISVEYWPVPLDTRLPRVSVPLSPGIPDVPIDLQDVLNIVYDRGAYAKLLDYDENPTPVLSDAQAEWADALLREKGLRR